MLYGTLCTLCYNSGFSLNVTTTCIHAYALIYTSYSPPIILFHILRLLPSSQSLLLLLSCSYPSHLQLSGGCCDHCI